MKISNTSSKIHPSKSNPNLINNEPHHFSSGIPTSTVANPSTSNTNTNPSILISTNANTTSSISHNTQPSSSSNNSINLSSFTQQNASTSLLESVLNHTNANQSNFSNNSNICLTNTSAGSLLNSYNIAPNAAIGLNSSPINSQINKQGTVLQSTNYSYNSNDERQISFYQEAKSSKIFLKLVLFYIILILHTGSFFLLPFSPKKSFFIAILNKAGLII